MDIEAYRSLLRDRTTQWKLATFVPNKKLPRYNWFYYKEGFARDEVFQLLDEFTPTRVLDPFCGSGTTLLACKERGIESAGVDALPISAFAARVKTAQYDPAQLEAIAEDLFTQRFIDRPSDFPFKQFFNRHVLADILFFRYAVHGIKDQQAREFFLLALISSAIKASYVWKDGTVLRVKEHPVPSFRKFFKRRVKVMIRDAAEVPLTAATADIHVGDALRIPFPPETFDAIITSPPYLNRIDYRKIYAIEERLLGQEARHRLLGFAGQDQGVQTYLSDLETFVKEMAKVLQPGGKAGLVIGNAYTGGAHAEIDLHLAAMGDEAGLRPIRIDVLNKRRALENRTHERGEVRESLVVLEKS